MTSDAAATAPDPTLSHTLELAVLETLHTTFGESTGCPVEVQDVATFLDALESVRLRLVGARVRGYVAGGSQ